MVTGVKGCARLRLSDGDGGLGVEAVGGVGGVDGVGARGGDGEPGVALADDAEGIAAPGGGGSGQG